jgi:hypothetical protein
MCGQSKQRGYGTSRGSLNFLGSAADAQKRCTSHAKTASDEAWASMSPLA